MYAGTFGDGVVKTTTGGAVWTAANTVLTKLAPYSPALDPTSLPNLYTGTWGGGMFALTPRRTRVGVYRTGTWYLDANGNGTWDNAGPDGSVVWGGVSGDLPVVGQW